MLFRSNGVIKFANVNFYVPPDTISAAIGITPNTISLGSQPGLTANGQPTSNAAASIPASEISVTDTYGFINTITENML